MSLVYADASALIKLAVHESETPALKRWLAGRSVVSSAISQVEVARGVRRSDALYSPPADVLREIDMVTVDDEVLNRARMLDPPTLRTLDAIHLATALLLETDVDVFVTYDRQQGRAATLAGFDVEAPR